MEPDTDLGSAVRWVAVESFHVRAMAELCAAHLRGSGIETRVFGDDAGGTAPHIGLGTSGVRVLVPEDQVDDAREVLAAIEP